MTREESLALYERLVATNPDVQRKGATMPYTSVNGHMFSLLTKEGSVALRLPDAEREKFLKKYKTVLCEQYGTVMKEYAVVPGRTFEKDARTNIKRYFGISFAYTSALKPKPTKRKKPASAKKKPR